MSSQTFKFRRRVAFHETDTAGIVHHSNHIKYFEEARVEWIRANGLIALHAPMGGLVFIVRDLRTQFMKPIRFDDEMEIRTEARAVGVRVYFQYWIHNLCTRETSARGWTELVPLDHRFQPVRISREAFQKFNSGPWEVQDDFTPEIT